MSTAVFYTVLHAYISILYFATCLQQYFILGYMTTAVIYAVIRDYSGIFTLC